ncbi:c-type cytochrome [Guyparkeria sp. TX1]|uniref:c-type cytochrome n=1 Tax=Guyparkeria sp. TX1 TaxID=3115001 RepID=UPI0039777637
MAQHTPKVDPMSKLVGFVSALVLLVAVFYLVNALFNTAGENSLEGQVVEKPETKEEETKTASADEKKSGGDEKSSAGGSGGDIAAGKEKYASCAACHGADGKGQGGAFPVLTGIPADEAEKKLAAYRDGDQDYLKEQGLGDRYGTMAPNAANLSDADIGDLAAFIGDEFGGGAGGSADGGDSESDGGSDGGNGGAVDGDVAAGKEAYASCAACHGADGNGQGGAFPVLTEMDAADVQKKLTAYREGDQDYLKEQGLGDRFGTMAPNASSLSDEQIANLSVYIADEFGGTNGGGGDAGASEGGDEAKSEGDEAKKEEKPAEPRIVSESVINRGRALYSSCAICHGAEGEGQELFNAPKLAGTKMDQTINLLKIYRKGQEMGPNSYAMIPQAKGLTDDDIEALGAYIAVMDKEEPPAEAGGEAPAGAAAQ